MSLPSVRRADEADLAALTELSLLAAERRHTLEPDFWPSAPDASARVEADLRRVLGNPDRAALFVLEGEGRLEGMVPALLASVPPVYSEGPAGLIADDFFVREDAPGGVGEALLGASEAFLRAGGATVLVAACPIGWTSKLALLEWAGYRQTTLYMLKAPTDPVPSAGQMARRATEADIEGLVALNREAQERKRDSDSRFWTPHPDAPARFGAWMRHSLTLSDREMFVVDGLGRLEGFAVAQPMGLPVAHSPSMVGALDDFHAWSFGWSLEDSDGSHEAAIALLAAAEASLKARGVSAVVAFCPVAWTAKRDVLEAQGYRTTSLWMLKDEP